jgi:hypothetical protein
MILKYGGYAHDDNEVNFTISMRTIRSSFGRGRGFRIQWNIMGVKFGNSFSDLTSKLTSLENAYGVDGQDLIFYDSDGSTLTRHSLYNANAFGQVKVQDFRYLKGNPGIWGSGTEYVNKRSYQIVVEADVLNDRSRLLSWKESVRTFGVGLEQRKWLESLTGNPQRQRLKRRTTIKAIQTGTAVGDTTWPQAATPLWPADEHTDRRDFTVHTPKFVVNGADQYPISWAYYFEGSLTPQNPGIINA